MQVSGIGRTKLCALVVNGAITNISTGRPRRIPVHALREHFGISEPKPHLDYQTVGHHEFWVLAAGLRSAVRVP